MNRSASKHDKLKQPKTIPPITKKKLNQSLTAFHQLKLDKSRGSQEWKPKTINTKEILAKIKDPNEVVKQNIQLKEQLKEMKHQLKKLNSTQEYMVISIQKQRIEITDKQRIKLVNTNIFIQNRLNKIQQYNRVLEIKLKRLQQKNQKLRKVLGQVQAKNKQLSHEINSNQYNSIQSQVLVQQTRIMKEKALNMIKELSMSDPHTIQLKFMELDDNFMQVIVKILFMYPSIQKVDLQGNQFTDRGVYILDQFLSSGSGNLQSLNLGFNKITLDGAWDLVNALSTREKLNSSVKSVSLSYNRIYDAEELYSKSWEFLKKMKQNEGVSLQQKEKFARMSSITSAFQSVPSGVHQRQQVQILTSVLDKIQIAKTNIQEISGIKKEIQRKKVQSLSFKAKSKGLVQQKKDETIVFDKKNMISSLLKTEDKQFQNNLFKSSGIPTDFMARKPRQELNIQQLLAQNRTRPITHIQHQLQKGLDINAVDTSTDQTLLMYASRTGNLNLVQLLINKSADINARNSQGQNSFLIACQHQNFQVAEFLLFSGSKVGSKNKEGANALHRAVLDQKPHVVSRLVEIGLSVNWADSKGKTPLHYAAQRGDKEIGDLLVQLGADLTPVDIKGRSPAALAEEKQQFEFADCLVRLGGGKQSEVAANIVIRASKVKEHKQKLMEMADDLDRTLTDTNKLFRKFEG